MNDVAKMKAELQELNYQLSCGVSFIEAMALTKQIKDLEERISIATATPRNLNAETPEYKPGRRASEMRRSKIDLSSAHGNGHDPLKVVERLWTR